MALTYNHDHIRAALALTDPATSAYLDLQTGDVIQVCDTDESPAAVELRDAIMAAYGERYRYIPGGNPAADEAAVAAWLEAEGLLSSA